MFAFIHQPKNQPGNLYAVIIPWWGVRHCLVIDLVREVPLSPRDYDINDIREAYKFRVTRGIADMIGCCISRGGTVQNIRPKAAEQYTKNESIIYHVGLMQIAELKSALQILKANSSGPDGDRSILYRSMFALYRLGYNQERDLINAAIEGRVNRMKELLEEGAYVNYDRCVEVSLGSIADSRPGPLHCAVENGQVDAIKFLLSVQDIEVNTLDTMLRSPLFKSKSLEVLKLLLADPRTCITVPSRQGWPLYYFCCHGDKSFVEALLNHIPEGPLPKSRRPLVVPLNKTFIESGTFKDHGTCLNAVCRIGRSELVSMLVEAGCDVNIRTSSGETPLLLAVKADHTEVVRALLQFPGVDTLARGTNDRDALLLATEAGNLEIASLLLEYPGMTLDALHLSIIHAARKGNQDMVSLFLNSEVTDAKCAKVALTAASFEGNPLMCQYLLDHPKSCSKTCIFPALDIATHMDVIRLLVLRLLEETEPWNHKPKVQSSQPVIDTILTWIKTGKNS